MILNLVKTKSDLTALIKKPAFFAINWYANAYNMQLTEKSAGNFFSPTQSIVKISMIS